MSLMLLGMTSSGSLAAFTAAAPQAQGLGSSGLRATGPVPGISPVAATGGAAASQGSAAQSGRAQNLPQPGAPPPATTLPRGSLLDLSV
ncbi:hypothetical protein [Acidisphaera rubrifaciens]|uniref:Uncharacterized protein n=1 Tax=Acidisphaera rubrifaciens HS-AP3 TaxID=1231350 RepID=A0A0D6P553_9PROT|nr:hypothetical protein [Acidisphaera rubrifaciens]GAN76019.1 hypothetical protein Asru_0045_10 [Acidisphaera rubrifaciens HS-AP3]